MSIGFYTFILSISDLDISAVVMSIFPLATTLGIMAIIVPGGLGVRESIMFGCLSMSGLSLTHATTITVAARFWFIFGEIFIFILGYITNKLSKTVNS